MDWCTSSPDKIGTVELGENCCKRHDAMYEKRSALEKIASDFMLFGCIAWQGIRAIVSGVLVVLYAPLVLAVVLTIGWKYFFAAKKGK